MAGMGRSNSARLGGFPVSLFLLSSKISINSCVPPGLRSATMCRRTIVALAALCLVLCAAADVSAQQKDLSEGLTRCLLTPEMLAR